MPQVLFGALFLLAILWGLSALAKADPRRVARGVKIAGGIAALLVAALMTATGRVAFAIPLGIAGLGLLGWRPGSAAGFGRRARKSPGQVSRVETAFLEMELDHDSGAMRGRFLAGPYAGAGLDALEVPALASALEAIDEESRSLLAAYLDRRDPRWRENAQRDAAAGLGSGAPGGSGGPMTQEEAYQILGLQPGASADEIGRAHRSLMKKLHPDQGGSTYLAARVNQAKDVLLGRHR